MLLHVDNLRIEFDTERGCFCAVDGISFSVDEGKTLGIVGESGCGKSVSALSLLRLLPEPPARVSGSAIRWRGEDLLRATPERLRAVRGGEIGVIFQEPMTSLNPVFSIGFQISEAIQVHKPEVSRSAAKARAVELLGLVGIPDPRRRFDDFPHQLSGGMRQRVMIAMALSCSPRLLVADEPTTALDVTIQAQILDLIARLRSELGMAVLLITHDLGVVSESVDDVIVMYAGQIVERANAVSLFRDPLHPYTRGLIASLPSEDSSKPLTGIPGNVPGLGQFPPGCRFADRCSLVQPRCRESVPPLETKRPGHEAACFEVKPERGAS